jgi:cation:H+ antiporter
MQLTLAVIWLVGGGVWLLMGGEILVRGALALARRARISPMVVGLTVVALGTSAPELVVTIQAALTGHPELAIANVVGSNIANVLLVVRLPALIYPLACDQASARSDALLMLVVSLAFYVICSDGLIDRLDGGILLAGLVVFLALQARTEREIPQHSGELPIVLRLPTRGATIAFLIIAGIIMLPAGSTLLITGALTIAEELNVSTEVIGLTIVALSTSLPELATTLVAAFKREADVAVGNVLGSNILNLVAIMGAASLASVRELEVSQHLFSLDLPLMLLSAVILTVVIFRRGAVGRKLGAALLGMYILYNYLLYSGL